MFIGQVAIEFGVGQKKKDEPEDGGIVEKPPSQGRSPNEEAFIKTPEAKEFVETWRQIKTPEGKFYTRRGLIAFLQLAYQARGNKTDREILLRAKDVIKMLNGKDNFFAAFGGLKAKSEGLIRGLKGILGMK